MSNVIGSADNSAFHHARQGLNRASDDMTQASLGIAGIAGQNATAAQYQPQPASNLSLSEPITQELIALNLSSINAQASARVLGVANDTVGQLIDTLA